MRNGLRVTALFIVVVGAGLWFFGGPHFGWTQTSRQVVTVDEITGLEARTWERHLTLGLDFLALVLGLAAAALAASCLPGRRRGGAAP
jgi:hypothetical protein